MVLFRAIGDSCTALHGLNAHSATPLGSTTMSPSRALESWEPHYNFEMLPTHPDQQDFESSDGEQSSLSRPLLQKRQSLPSINSILHQEFTRMLPTQQATPPPQYNSTQRMPIPYCHTSALRFRGTQSANTGAWWSQA